jgi:DNA end-binding protein Ku
MPRDNGLLLMLLRYPQELVDASDYKIPEGDVSDYRITSKEMEMAEQLIDSMSDEWTPGDYRDEFRERLRAVIEKRMKSKGVVTPPSDDDGETPEDASTNVVDFMALLQKSLETKQRTPARKTAEKKTVEKKEPRKPAATKSASKSAASKKKPAAKSAKKTARRKSA